LEKENIPHNTSPCFKYGCKNRFYEVNSIGKLEVVSRNKKMYPISRSILGSNG